MRLAPWMLAAAAMGTAIVVAVLYLGNPRVVERTVTKPLPANPTRAQIEAAFANLKPLGTGEQINPAGNPVTCSAADSTGDPDAPDFDWYVMWCVKDNATAGPSPVG